MKPIRDMTFTEGYDAGADDVGQDSIMGAASMPLDQEQAVARLDAALAG